VHPPCARPILDRSAPGFYPAPPPAGGRGPGWAAFHLDDHIAFCGWEPCGFEQS
jgi:hypothetical protein